MNQNSQSFERRARRNQEGQTIVLMLFLMVALLGMFALSVDVGLAYVSARQLQTSTDAAALAGAENLPLASATTTATTYSGVSGSKNAYSNLLNVTMVTGYPKAVCLSTLTGEGIPCVAPASANAIVVAQKVSVPMGFAGLFGFNTFSLQAVSTAAMRGSAVAPYNVMLIIDTTDSMNQTDTDSTCNDLRINCALSGVRTLLSTLSPCSSKLSNCGSVTAGNVANPVDTVGMMVFPGLSATTQAQYEYDCSNSPAPGISNYTLSPLPTYQVVPFSSDYRGSDTTTSLSTTSNIVLASRGKSSCNEGLDVVGGKGTFYAGVINAAQSALATAAANRPNSQNVLILLSDGDANASSSHLSGYSTANQCHQAITAAQNAAAAGTRVYAVAYGAEASGCSTDSPSITPCQAMQQIASSPSTFFSDYTAKGGSGSCVSAARPISNLTQIFTEIGGDLTVSRLIPNGTP